MQETLRTEGILLRHYPVGENHRNIVCLSPERGLFSATVYGAQGKKSRLRPLVFPFHRVTGDFSHDSVRDRWRVKDLVSLEAFEGVRGEVERYYTASLWAEVLIKSLGRGEPRPELYSLLNRALAGLAEAAPDRVFFVSAPFLWGYLAEEGVQPDLDQCGRCGGPAGEGGMVWSDRDESFLCPRCAASSGTLFPLSPGMRRYLRTAGSTPLHRAAAVGLDRASAAGLRRVLYHILQAHLEAPLKTLRSGFV